MTTTIMALACITMISISTSPSVKLNLNIGMLWPRQASRANTEAFCLGLWAVVILRAVGRLTGYLLFRKVILFPTNQKRNYKASCLDDFHRFHKAHVKLRERQDNKYRPDSPILPPREGEIGVSMAYLPPLLGRVDNQNGAPPLAGEPLGVVIVDRASSLHSKSLYSQLQLMKNDLHPRGDIVYPRSCVTIIKHTHLGRLSG